MEEEYKHRRDHFNKSDDSLKQEAYSYNIKGFNLKMTIICSITSELLEDFFLKKDVGSQDINYLSKILTNSIKLKFRSFTQDPEGKN